MPNTPRSSDPRDDTILQAATNHSAHIILEEVRIAQDIYCIPIETLWAAMAKKDEKLTEQFAIRGPGPY
jgi:hypothetical protein